ncbi:hypothetical protein [Streptomyces sp. NPDC059398]|uniref:hypothetical protein n=1 Tax=Streptomyces sp. NPDC059398 TaxID=3346820 RepID=UPI0036849F66
MTTAESDAVKAAVRVAQSVTINAKWRLCEEEALRRLATCPGLACAPLFPEHPVIQVIAVEGRLLGRARLSRTGKATRWIATAADTGQQVGVCHTLRGAARALNRTCGRHSRLRVTCLPGAGSPR